MRRRPIQASIRTRPDDEGAPGAGLAAELREALSYWASGVAVLAVSDGEEVDAVTVTAFSGVSLDPPLVLACLGVQSPILPMVRDEKRFTVSLLAGDDQRTANAIAQRLPLDAARIPVHGDPVVSGALVALVCRLRDEHPGGDHRILVGEVERVEPGREADPLLYFRREYRGLGE